MYAFAKTLLAGSLIVVAPALVMAQAGHAEHDENGKMVAKIEKRVLTLAGARMVAAAAESEARRLNTTGAVAVVDDGGNLLYLLRIDNTFPPARTSRWTRRERPRRSACPREIWKTP